MTEALRGAPQGVSLRNVSKRFGEVVAVADANLEVLPGELMVLVGPSGCGKSTLLRLVAGLEEPCRGEVRIGGRRVDELPPGRRDVAMVFQNYALYPHMTVARNLGFGLRMRGVEKDAVRRRVRRTARSLGIEELLDRRPGQLSGGQQQRVALGRAMVREPGVFLFDEPLSNLDAGLRLRTRDEVAALHRRLATTMILVTHDQIEALSLGDRVAVMDRGLIQQVGTPGELYRRPANLFVAAFLGSPPVNQLAAVRRDDGHLEGGPFAFRGDWPGQATLAVRPEDLSLVADPGAFSDFTAAVVRVEALGSEQRLHLDGPGDAKWIARVPPTPEAAAGDEVRVAVSWERAHLFGPDDRRAGTPPRPAKARP